MSVLFCFVFWKAEISICIASLQIDKQAIVSMIVHSKNKNKNKERRRRKKKIEIRGQDIYLKK